MGLLDREHRPIHIFLIVAFGLFAFFLWRGHQLSTKEKRKSPTPSSAEASRSQQIQKFRLTGFDQKGKTFWNLEGDAAKIDTQQTVYMDNSVTFRLQDDTVVKTDHVQWRQAQGILWTKAPVTVTNKQIVVTGVGALGRPNESFIQLNRDIEMELEPQTVIRCRGPLKIYYGNNQMTFYRSVEVHDARGVLQADRMRVSFDPEDKKVRDIVASGHVSIVRGSDVTHSEKATYNPRTGSIRLEGNPEITIQKKESGLFNPYGALRN